MTSKFASLALCLSGLLCLGCNSTVGNNQPGTETRTVSWFTQVSVNDIMSAQASGGSRVVLEGVDRETLSLAAGDGASLIAEGSVDTLVVSSADGASLTCDELSATTA